MLMIIKNALYLLALINPASKVLLLSSMRPQYSRKKLYIISLRSTLVSFFILLIISLTGHFLLRFVFNVDIYSLKVAGGIVLFIVGLTAIRKGRFFEAAIRRQPDDADISIVPLSTPLIAGPGTMTAIVSLSSEYGILSTIIALLIAVLVNFIFMVSSLWIGKVLDRVHAIGPLIRIAGLIVATVAVQMILQGSEEWLESVISTN